MECKITPSRRAEDAARLAALVPQLAERPAVVRFAYRGATDPGLRRSYVEVARRLGEVDGREELEMWALQEESR